MNHISPSRNSDPPGVSTIQGQIERVTFYNDETDFTIARVKVPGYRDLVTVVGTLMAPAAGQVVRATGEWINHPEFGEQFKILRYTTLIPATVAGIEKYLGSGLIKGIGPVMAKRMVKKFEEDTLKVIEEDAEKLLEVEGIGSKRVKMIAKAWTDQKEIREVMLFLQTHGVSSTYAAKIFKQYGQQSIDVVKENPYKLAEDIFGIGFITADRIAQNLGIEKDSPLRAEAGVIYTLNQLADEDHVCYPHEALVDKSREILQVDRDVALNGLQSLVAQKKVVLEYFAEDENAPPGDNVAAYLSTFHACEKNIAYKLKSLLSAPLKRRKIDADKAVEWVQAQLSLSLAGNQIAAVKCAAVNKIMVITGGPGTGKTTIINSILKIFSRLGLDILLAAPTGRAAKRMTEATGHEARTIHRLLEFSPRKRGFQKDEESPLKCDLLILDEASMIDTVLMHHLLKAVPIHATLILVGDVNQLPSVGPGNVLKDIIASGTVPVAFLTEIFRQAKDSAIIVNAHRINEGVIPDLDASRTAATDFYFIWKEEPEEALQVILELLSGRIQRAFGFDPTDDLQVLSPMNRGTAGPRNLNIELQKILNPREDGITRGGRNFRINDKVMQIRNNYDKDVYNGDIGRILKIDTEDQEVVVMFDGRRVTYDYSDLDELVLAYAVSVHKSQGSEYPCVVIPLLTQHYVMLQRNLLYTAITRGKKLVILVGSKRALAIAIKNDKTQKRYTHLRDRLSSR
jgi:exodeoxyribonuclease V alpha subunit